MEGGGPDLSAVRTGFVFLEVQEDGGSQKCHQTPDPCERCISVQTIEMPVTLIPTLPLFCLPGSDHLHTTGARHPSSGPC